MPCPRPNPGPQGQRPDGGGVGRQRYRWSSGEAPGPTSSAGTRPPRPPCRAGPTVAGAAGGGEGRGTRRRSARTATGPYRRTTGGGIAGRGSRGVIRAGAFVGRWRRAWAGDFLTRTGCAEGGRCRCALLSKAGRGTMAPPSFFQGRSRPRGPPPPWSAAREPVAKEGRFEPPKSTRLSSRSRRHRQTPHTRGPRTPGPSILRGREDRRGSDSGPPNQRPLHLCSVGTGNWRSWVELVLSPCTCHWEPYVIYDSV